MKVSVIVPTYNRAHMVTETIDSILNQTFTDFELIIVDSCSTDNTESVVKSYDDKRIRYLKNEKSRIIAANRNCGIRKARGEYIAFCDDDDLWLPEKLERQLAEFEKDSQIGLVCSNGIHFDEKGDRGILFGPEITEEDFTLKRLVFRDTIIGCSILIKKSVLDDVGLLDERPELFAAENYELWLRVAKKYKIKYIDLPLIKYRTHSGVYRKTGSERVELLKAVYAGALDKQIIDFELYKKAIGKRNYEFLVQELKSGDSAVSARRMLETEMSVWQKCKGIIWYLLLITRTLDGMRKILRTARSFKI